MDIENLATSAIRSALAKTDRISTFINDGDKEPCWDGHIYIHENEKKTKKNIKKIPVQIKGKKDTTKKVQRTIKYRISRDDLYAYMMNGGIMFFVVYLDEKTGDTKQIYYSDLLPIRIKKILNIEKKTYSVKFRKFPDNNNKKTEVILNFYEDAQRQTSFAGKETPSIQELMKQGMLESLTFKYVGIGRYGSYRYLPKLIDGQPLTLYANIKGGTIPIPVEYYESVKNMVMNSTTYLPVSVKGEVYYHEYQVVTTSDENIITIGTSVSIRMPLVESVDDKYSVKLKIHINGTLQQRIDAMKFVQALIENGSFCINEWEVPSKFPDEELEKINIKEFPNIIESYIKLKQTLDILHVKKDLNISDCTEEDYKKLNFIVSTIRDRKKVRKKPNYPQQMFEMKVANLNLAFVYIQDPNGGYRIFDYFGNHFDVFWVDDGNKMRISQFSTMRDEDFLNMDNLDLDTVVKDYSLLEPNEDTFELCNLTVLEILKAYDKQPTKELLNAARDMINWLINHPDYTVSDIVEINKLQIILREREFTFEEKTVLHSIIAKTNDSFIKAGALLLLDEQDEVKRLMEKENLDSLKGYPIYRFYKCKEMEKNNGKDRQN